LMDDIQINIAIDAMGGDNSPTKVIKGCEIFLNFNKKIKLIIFGNKNLISNNFLEKYSQMISFVHCEETIADNDVPSSVLRSKKNSSMRKAIEYIKSKKNIGFVSAGNTGAVTALSTILLGTLKNIKRPAFCSMIPTSKGFCIMLDLGANKESNENQLLQFSIMGHAFAKTKNISNPKVAILNIGTEEGKGKEYLQEAYNLINNSFLSNDFIGYIEPDQITMGKADVIVTDGFTGNIALKTAEGTANFISKNLKDALNKLSILLSYSSLKRFKNKLDPRKYNGAIFLGLQSPVVKSHGSTDSIGFANSINVCNKIVKANLIEKIESNLITFDS